MSIQNFGRVIVSVVLIGLMSHSVHAGEVLDSPPPQPDTAKKYLFYMHGRHVERRGPNGAYEIGAILGRLAKEELIVIGEVRSDTNPRSYSGIISTQVTALLDAGVPAKNITVAGHSRGGFMTMLSSARLQNKSVKFAVLAGCGIVGSEFRRSYERFSNRRARNMLGRFLVVWDADDDVTRECDLAMKKADVEFRNLEFNTGKGHRLFYRPDPIWIEPLANFALSD